MDPLSNSIDDELGAIDDTDLGAIDDTDLGAVDPAANPYEVNIRLEQDKKNMVTAQALQEKQRQEAEQNNPQNWTLQQTKDYFKKNPPQTIEEEAVGQTLLGQKKEQLKHTQNFIEGTQLKAAPPKNVFGKMRDKLTNVLGDMNIIESPEGRQARSQVALAIAQKHNLDPVEVENHYEDYFFNPKYTGITPTNIQPVDMINAAMTPAVVAGIVMSPEVTIPALAVFGVLDALAPTGALGPGFKTLADLQKDPRLTYEAKQGIELIDMTVKGGIAGLGAGKAGAVLRKKFPQFKKYSDFWHGVLGKDVPKDLDEAPAIGDTKPKLVEDVAGKPAIVGEEPPGKAQLIHILKDNGVDRVNPAELAKYPELQKIVEDAKVMHQKAAQVQPEINAVVESIKTDLQLSQPQHANQKKVASIVSKSLRRNKAPEQLSDLTRGAIVLDNASVQNKQAGDLLIAKGFQRVGDYGTEMWGGYRPYHYTKTFENGIQGEIQIHTPATWSFKTKVSDRVYRNSRADLNDYFQGKLSPAKNTEIRNKEIALKKEWDRIYAEGGFGASSEAISSGVAARASSKSPESAPGVTGTQEPFLNTEGGAPAAEGAVSTKLPSGNLSIDRSINENIPGNPMAVKSVVRNDSSRQVAADLADYVSGLEGPQTLKSLEGAYTRTNDWPPFLSNQGYTKAELLNVMEKFRSGVKLTERQQGIVDYVLPEFAKQINVQLSDIPGKRRKFIQTVKSAEKTNPEVARKIESLYEPITNKETLRQAQEFIAEDYNGAVELVNGPGRPTAFSNTVAISLIDKYQAEGRVAEAISLVEKTAEKNTGLGQAIQALSMYERLTPEGILRYADKVVRDAREKVPKKKLDELDRLKKILSKDDYDKMADKLGVPHISEILAKELLNMANKIKEMPEGREKKIQTALMLKKIGDMVPPGILKKLAMGQTLAQLLNPKTFIRNFLGNLGFQLIENTSDTLATAMDVAVSMATKNRSVFLPSPKEQGSGFIKGLKEGTEEALAGIDLKNSQSKFTLPKAGVFNNKVLSSLEKTLRVSLGAPDRAFYQSAFNQSIRDQMLNAKRQKLDILEPTEDMIERAHLLGLYRTFQDDNLLSNQFVKLKKWFNAGKDFGVGDVVLKYPKTPGNIMARGIEYSPFGFFKAAYELTKPLIGKEFDQAQFVRSSSRALVGTTGLVGTGAMLANLGIISGKRSSDRDVQATRENVGIKDYQINVSALKRFMMSGMDPELAKMEEGDTLVSYDWFLPASIGLAMGANMVLDPKTNKVDALLNFGERMLQASETLQEQPLVRGVKVLTQKENIAQGLSDTLQDIPASFVPTLLNQVRQLADNTSRNTKDPNWFKETYNKAIMRVPGISSQLDPKITPLGEEKQMYQLGSNNPFNVFLNPAFVTKYNPDPVSKMVLDIWEMSGETVQFPRVAAAKIKLGSDTPEPVELTAAQYTEYQRYIGHKTDVIFSILAEDQDFLALPDEEKAKKLQRILTDINTAAKVEILGYQPKKYSDDVVTIIQDIGRAKQEIDKNFQQSDEKDLGAVDE